MYRLALTGAARFTADRTATLSLAAAAMTDGAHGTGARQIAAPAAPLQLAPTSASMP